MIAVLLVLAFVAVIGAEFAYSMRLEASAARIYKETLIATHLAEAGIEQATRELAAEFAFVALGDDKDAGVDPAEVRRVMETGAPRSSVSAPAITIPPSRFDRSRGVAPAAPKIQYARSG